MNKKSIFSGAWCPSVTPFTTNGKLDFRALEKHLCRITDAGTDVILIMGSIGEFTSLNQNEKLQLIHEARNMTDIPLVVNVSSTCIDDLKQLADRAYTVGYDAVMFLPHYYFGQTYNQMFEYYLQIGSAIEGKWLAYNFPARTGCSLDAKLVAALAAEMPNFVGIKDTVDTLSHTRAIIREVKAIRPDFQVLSGFDEYFIPNLLSGGSGVISGLNNIVPELFVQAIDTFNDGHLEKAAEIQQLIGKYSSIYTIGEDFVTTIKTVVSRKFGYMTPASRSYGAALSRQACMETDALFGTQYEFNNAIIPTVV